MDCSRARTRDPLEWLEICPEFSGPLANQVREWILTWSPDLEESIKWNMLCFSGRKLVCGLSACLHHLGITFFRGAEIPDPTGLFGPQNGERAVIRTVRLTGLDGLNVAALRSMVISAVDLDGTPSLLPAVPRGRREPIPVPDFFAEALRRKPAAAAGFARMSPSCQREYLVWLSSAKRPETRARRLRETLAAVTESRRWSERRG
jgi:uncharacterized protein YdeI (YjbR/CyaY-like superfamily)